jgi:hypothetical protein
VTVRLVPTSFDVYRDECRAYLGISVGKDRARHAANVHRKADRTRLAAAAIVVHEAKLEGASTA